MRAISLVNRIELEFSGNVARNAIALGDIDHDGCNELIVGNSAGEVAIYKGKERVQTISNVGFVTCIAIGDVLNKNKNSVVIVTGDGWCYVYEKPFQKEEQDEVDRGIEEVDGQIQSTSTTNTETPSSSESTSTSDRKSKKEDKKQTNILICVHVQRIPANTKNILLGDVDNDGAIEMVLGLTDRVVRSYRWMSNPNKPLLNIIDANFQFDRADKFLGKFIALNKWECANQIGSITLHHSWDGTPSLLVAQPGGTFMRIKCQSEDSPQDSENKLSNSSSSQTETIPGTVDYQFLGISRMRNQNISTEILGDLRCPRENSVDNCSETTSVAQKSDSSGCDIKGRPYSVATLDGTIMLVQDEVILWAIAVDHQIFALTKLDITGNGADDIVVCSWDGQTYILDQEKNSVRFHLEEPVQAFQSGWYNLSPDKPDITALVYVTFKSKIIIYYDIPLRNLICKRFEPDLEKLSELFVDEHRSADEALEYVKEMDRKTKCELVKYLLYNVKS